MNSELSRRDFLELAAGGDAICRSRLSDRRRPGSWELTSDPDSYKIKQEKGRSKVHSLSPFLLFVSGR